MQLRFLLLLVQPIMVFGINMFIHYTLTIEQHPEKIWHSIDNEENPELGGVDTETTAGYIHLYTSK